MPAETAPPAATSPARTPSAPPSAAGPTAGTAERSVTVGSRVGLHARPAAAVAKLAAAQPVVVMIATDGGTPVDCRSMLSLLSLGAEHGTAVTLTAQGEGAQAAVDAVADLVARDQDHDGGDA